MILQGAGPRGYVEPISIAFDVLAEVLCEALQDSRQSIAVTRKRLRDHLYARHTRAVRDAAQVTICEELPVSSRWTIGQLEGWLTACADALRARVAVEGVPADARVIDGGRLVIW